jgi:hypothetical protein
MTHLHFAVALHAVLDVCTLHVQDVIERTGQLAHTTAAHIATALAAVVDPAPNYTASALCAVITVSHITNNVPFAYFGSVSASTITLSFPVGFSIVSASASATATSEANLTITEAGDAAPEYALVYDDGTVAADTIGETPSGYPADAVVPYLVSGGQCSVASPGTVTTGNPVWIDTETGVPGIAPTPVSVAHPTHRWVLTDANSSSPSLAIIGA